MGTAAAFTTNWNRASATIFPKVAAIVLDDFGPDRCYSSLTHEGQIMTAISLANTERGFGSEHIPAFENNGTKKMNWKKTVLFACASLLCFIAGRAQAPEYDLVITGGTVFDGTGAAGVSADLGLKDGEIVELAKVVRPHGGIYASHIRDESNYTTGLKASIAEAIVVGEEAGVPVEISHIKALGKAVWGQAPEVCRMIEAAQARGVRVYADQYPYNASSTSLADATLARWVEADGKTRERLQDPKLLPKIKQYVIEKRIITMQHAIRAATGLPAEVLGLKDRGLIKQGFAADIVVFDPATMADRATYEKPHQYSEGIDYVLVNGRLAVDEGKVTGMLAGRPLPLAREIR
jgi:N-acyl-D-aspartate/D-glutamate deacylase